jgi:hypothetical protein
MRSSQLLAVAFVCALAPAMAVADDSTPKSDSTAPVAAAAAAVERPTQKTYHQPATPLAQPGAGAKIGYYLHSAASFRNFLDAGFIAGIPNLPSAPVQPPPPANYDIPTMIEYKDAMTTYGYGMDDWRRASEDELRYRQHRLETGLATAETRDFLGNLVLPLALRQHAQYIPASFDENLGLRLGHAFASAVVTRSDSGRLVPNVSKWGGIIGSAYIAKSFYADQFNAPELNSNHFVAHYIGYSIAGDVATNLGHELVRGMTRSDIENYMTQGTATQGEYYPLSFGGKLVYWGRSAYAPRNFIQGALIAGIPDIQDMPEFPAQPVITNQDQLLAYDKVLVRYGMDVQSWRDNLENNVRYHEHRLIGGFGESETQQFLSNFFVPVATRMDPRYIPLGTGHSFGARLGNAFTGVAVGHMDSGRRMVNLPVVVGTLGAAFIAKQAYYPMLNTPSLESNRVLGKTVGFNLAGDALLNVLGEFLHHSSY